MPAKHVKQFSLFVSRDAFNIEGMSEATLEKLIQHGFLHEPADLFHLDNYHDEIVQLDGFGRKVVSAFNGICSKRQERLHWLN